MDKGGHGLGLSIARIIVLRHGGRIKVASNWVKVRVSEFFYLWNNFWFHFCSYDYHFAFRIEKGRE